MTRLELLRELHALYLYIPKEILAVNLWHFNEIRNEIKSLEDQILLEMPQSSQREST